MTRFIPERPDIMDQMIRDQNDARRGGSPEDEILQYLVDVYHPSFRELRYSRNFGNLRNYIPANERMLISDKVTRKEINQYNKDQRLVQEIGARREDWTAIDKTRLVWVYVLLKGEDARAARARNEREMEGKRRKGVRLNDAIRNTARRARAADSIRRSVQAAIRRGRRRGP